MKANKGVSNEKIKIIPLGGLEHIGMNITCIEYEDSIIVIDCGLSFPDEDMLGVDLVIPDVTYLKDNIEKVKGFVITHGHEDHIGALPYVLQSVNAPVYATKLTMGIIEHKLKEHNMMKTTKRKVVRHGQSINLGCFRIEFIKTNHSIADAAALAIYTPAGIIVHTGDFKIDYTPVFGEMIDLIRFAELGKKGVLALLCESTNAERPGFTQSERTVGKTISRIFDDHKKSRIIIATFASNVDRVQQIINAAYEHGRKVIVEGRSMVNIITIASELGYIKSSNPIPGNEKAVTNVINELYRKGAEVIFQDTHVSGHACQEEIKLIYALTKPKYAIPVHGEYKHLKAGAKLAETMGVQKDHIMLMQSGDILTIGQEKAEITGQVPHGCVMVDGLGVGDVGNIVLRDRQMLSQNGLLIVVLTLEKYSNQLLAGPDIVSRGFVYVRESESLMEDARRVVSDALDDCLNHNISDWSKIKNVIRDSLGDFLWKQTKRNPMILPIIMEV